MYEQEKIVGYVGGFYVGSEECEVDVHRWRWQDWDETRNGFLVVIGWGNYPTLERVVTETDYYSLGEIGSFRKIFCEQYDEDTFIAFVEKLGAFLETINKGNPDVSLKVELYI